MPHTSAIRCKAHQNEGIIHITQDVVRAIRVKKLGRIFRTYTAVSCQLASTIHSTGMTSYGHHGAAVVAMVVVRIGHKKICWYSNADALPL